MKILILSMGKKNISTFSISIFLKQYLLNRFIEDDDGWDKCFIYLSELKLQLHNLNTSQSHHNADANNIEISKDKLQKDVISKEISKPNAENCLEKINEIKNKIVDLLQLYLILPVSVEMLKTNSAAKIIKHFIKSHYSGQF